MQEVDPRTSLPCPGWCRLLEWTFPSAKLDPPRIALSTHGLDITGPQARQLAAALLNAADEWDRL